MPRGPAAGEHRQPRFTGAAAAAGRRPSAAGLLHRDTVRTITAVFRARRRRRPGPRIVLPAMLLATLTGALAIAECPSHLARVVPDHDTRARLLADGLQEPLTTAGPSLAPELVDRSLIVEWMDAIAVTYGAEVLRLIRVSGGTDCRWTDLYNHLRAVSTLEGIEYYSASRGYHRTLYHQSYAIAGAEDRTRLPDPVAGSVPERSTLYLLQEDSTFGSNVYRTDFRFDGTAITMRVRNLTTMWWSILPLVDPGNFRSVVSVTPTDQGLLFYAAAGIHTISIGGVRERSESSLRNRLDALERWLRAHLS